MVAEEKGVPLDGRGKYEIRVIDSGIGMSEEFAEKVFEAFERENTSTVSGIQGTGLGMSITKSIVDLMGGSIDLKTESGKGTEFIIRLEFELQDDKEEAGNDETQTEKKEHHEHLANFSNMRVLLAEDIPINREIAVMQLTGFGFKVDTAENGRMAVDKVSTAEPGYYDAVLMDIQMPEMDGYEAAETIRRLDNERLAAIPIIAMTANAFAEDVKKAEEAGMNGHIAKPIDMNDMLNVLREVLGGP